VLKIITTSDGSHSLLNEELNETYHSIHGAIQESAHVFIESGLEYAEENFTTPVSIFELGFGTGLNALLTLRHSLQHQKKIQYTSIEESPLREEIWSQLNYAPLINLTHEFEAMHRATWGTSQHITPDFSLLKLHATFQQFDIPYQRYELIYYDAFAPSKQPELWSYSILEKISHGLKPGGVIVTYCAKGQLKRDLASLGLIVETLPGPPGKKEMVRAVKPKRYDL
jgi:tRNA U34 5-methylaminomethyl-2-thiouridine-forming methyltransferase MnmC